jgi:hypothetical protein
MGESDVGCGVEKVSMERQHVGKIGFIWLEVGSSDGLMSTLQ